eukprot:1414916-Heterocapsa_arctica.AAC.1
MPTFTCDMREFVLDAAAKFQTEIGVQRLPPVHTPHLADDFAPQTIDTPGIHVPTASSHLMKLLFTHSRE